MGLFSDRASLASGFIETLLQQIINTDFIYKEDVREFFWQYCHANRIKNFNFFHLIGALLRYKLIKRGETDLFIFRKEAIKKFITKHNKENKVIYNNLQNSDPKNNLLKSNIRGNVPNSRETSPKKNKKKLISQNVAIPSPKIQFTKYVTKEKCDLCNYKFKSESEISNHIQSEAHKLRHIYRTNKKELISPNTDLLIKNESEGPEELKIIDDLNRQNRVELKIFNNTTVPYDLVEVLPLYTKLNNEIQFENGKLPIRIKQRTHESIKIKYCFMYPGIYSLPIIFKTVNKGTSVAHNFLKELKFNIQGSDELDVSQLQQTAPFKRRNKGIFEIDDLEIIDGIRPPPSSTTGLDYVISLARHDLPTYIIKLLNYGLKENVKMSNREKEYLNNLLKLLNVENPSNCLTKKNYCEMLETLLYFEEHQMQIDIREYDCENQQLHRIPNQPKLLSLNVPGLAEDRPSLIRGDNLTIAVAGSGIGYKGYIHRIEKTRVQLGFDNRFVQKDYNDLLRFNVTFGFNRHTIRTEHQAVELIKKHHVQKLFFPELPKIHIPLLDVSFIWFQSQITDNEQQKQAVKHIVAGTSGNAPYLLFGPPGTGKTMTMVEAILQLWKMKPKSKMLVAAPSNSAANEITKRLIKFVPKSELFRMISVSFAFDKVDDDVRPCCNHRDGEYYYPPIDTLERYRILIVTLSAAAKLVNGGVGKGHFEYIFIDESGHSTESELLIPIAGIITHENEPGRLLGRVVLAGDPKQLGPIIHSKLAHRYGFGISMLERLMTHSEIYKKDSEGKYNSNMVTKLLKNFRSHQAILKLPDEMFYDKELVPKGNELVDIAIGWDELRNKKFPLIFHNVKGEDKQEDNSPSYFNIEEIKTVDKYLHKLIGRRLKGKMITQNDIGIVTPYRKQVQKLQQACKKNNWHDILIGSVEQFQGQERLIIIVSTVRSRQELLERDYQFHLGFLRNPKRFNVALTRAKALVIVVGNADILQWDEHWGSFIEYCKNNQAVCGAPFDFKQSWLKRKDNNDNVAGAKNHEEEEVESEDEIAEHSNFSRGRK